MIKGGNLFLKYGYVRNQKDEISVAQQSTKLLSSGCELLFVEKKDNENRLKELERMNQMTGPGDSIYFYSLNVLGFRMETLLNYLKRNEEKKTTLVFIKEKINTSENIDMPLGSIVEKLYQMERKSLLLNFDIKSESSKEVGRPSIDKDKVVQLITLREQNKLTYREIAKLTDLALGTVYKYIKHYEANIKEEH